MVMHRSTAAALFLVLGLATVGPIHAAAATATLSGDVKDELGRALADAEILVLSPDPNAAAASTLSNASGRFLVDHLAPGVYRVAALKSGYVAAIGVVNTYLRSSVELVLHPVPKGDDARAKTVQEDLSWTLRVPPRSVLEHLDPTPLLASTENDDAGPFRLPDSIRGQVDHVVALGAFRPSGGGPSSSLQGNETRMQFGGSLGDRGAIQVAGRHGSLDSSGDPSPAAAVSRAASDVDVDVSYDTGDDARLGMRAFYSTGDLEIGERPGVMNQGARQGQRSWGYEGQWRKQVDGSSRLAVQVGIHDSNLDLVRSTSAEALDQSLRDASNRSIGAEGQYESLAGDHHLLRFGIRAQVMDLAAPLARIGRVSGAFPLEGPTGWSLLLDAEDQWSLSGPIAVSYGLAYRQGFDGPFTATATPRVGASWTSGRFRGHAQVEVLATEDWAGGTGPTSTGSSLPVGYGLEVQAPLTRTMTVRGTVSSTPLRANVWKDAGDAKDLQELYVTDGQVADQFVALALERAAGSATITFRVAQGRADGVLAPALDRDVPVLLLADRTLTYRSVRLGTLASRTGSSLSFEYRDIADQAVGSPLEQESLQTVEAEFAQQLARLAGGRASCRLLITARSAVGPPPRSPEADPSEARRFAALYQRLGAGVSLAF